MMFARLAVESDEEAVVELYRIGVEESQPGHTFVPEMTRTTFHQYINTANPTYFVVEENRQVIGLLKATMSAYDFTDGFYTTLEIIFVRPDKRGSRAAALLAREFFSWSDRLGAKENTGGIDNNMNVERTASFLKKFGMRDVGTFMRRGGRVVGE